MEVNMVYFLRFGTKVPYMTFRGIATRTLKHSCVHIVKKKREISAWNYSKICVKYPLGARNDNLYFKNFLGETLQTPPGRSGIPPSCALLPSSVHTSTDAFGISFEYT